MMKKRFNFEMIKILLVSFEGYYMGVIGSEVRVFCCEFFWLVIFFFWKGSWVEKVYIICLCDFG